MTVRHIPSHILALLTFVLSVDVHARVLLQQPTTVFSGNVAVRLIHREDNHEYILDFYEDDQTAVRQILDVPDMPPNGPPAAFYTGVCPSMHMCMP